MVDSKIQKIDEILKKTVESFKKEEFEPFSMEEFVRFVKNEGCPYRMELFSGLRRNNVIAPTSMVGVKGNKWVFTEREIPENIFTEFINRKKLPGLAEQKSIKFKEESKKNQIVTDPAEIDRILTDHDCNRIIDFLQGMNETIVRRAIKKYFHDSGIEIKLEIII